MRTVAAARSKLVGPGAVVPPQAHAAAVGVPKLVLCRALHKASKFSRDRADLRCAVNVFWAAVIDRVHDRGDGRGDGGV